MHNRVSVDDQLKQIISPSGKSYYHVQRQRARVTAVVLAAATVVSLIFLVFAFVQKAAADSARAELVKNESLAQKNEMLARQLQLELQHCRQVSGK